MKRTYVRVELYDPFGDGVTTYPVSEGIDVEISEIHPVQPLVGFKPLRLENVAGSGLFVTNAPHYRAGPDHYFRVGFKKPNFSLPRRQLLSRQEVLAGDLPVLIPSRVPYWDTGWPTGFKSNPHFDKNGIRVTTDETDPLVLRVPLRRFFIVGHRGFPHLFPENTIASFRAALDHGANGLEFDLNFTRDGRIVVFHDPQPVKQPGNLDRTSFESLPYELVSPEFSDDGKTAFIVKLRGGSYERTARNPMDSTDELDIINLTLDEVRAYYRYRHVDNVEHGLPDLDEFLGFAAGETSRLKFLFFDVKNPSWDPAKKSKYQRYASVLADALRRFPSLPETLVISNPDEAVLGCFKEVITASGESRCSFAVDAEGSLGALIGVGPDPLRIARKMKNSVVSIGSLLRPGHMEEIMNAARDRDYNDKSPVDTVLQWTVNDPAQMHKSLIAGTNGILTDRPDELKKVLNRVGIVVS